MFASTGDGGVRTTRRVIFELVSLVLSLIICWTARILPMVEEDQYTDFLSIAQKQTKAGPRRSKLLF